MASLNAQHLRGRRTASRVIQPTPMCVEVRQACGLPAPPRSPRPQTGCWSRRAPNVHRQTCSNHCK
eukprot:5830559-Alexandrium_andersonii.AAC.1